MIKGAPLKFTKIVAIKPVFIYRAKVFAEQNQEHQIPDLYELARR